MSEGKAKVALGLAVAWGALGSVTAAAAAAYGLSHLWVWMAVMIVGTAIDEAIALAFWNDWRNRHGVHGRSDSGDRVHAGDGAADRADAPGSGTVNRRTAWVPFSVAQPAPGASGGAGPGVAGPRLPSGSLSFGFSLTQAQLDALRAAFPGPSGGAGPSLSPSPSSSPSPRAPWSPGLMPPLLRQALLPTLAGCTCSICGGGLVPPPPREERTGYAIGFRAWAVGAGGLQSIIVLHHWEPGTMTASHVTEGLLVHPSDGPPCVRGGSPHRDCSCGIYAYKSPALAAPVGAITMHQAGHVAGIVAGWGRVFEHREGFRCQHARILALIGEVGDQITLVSRTTYGAGVITTAMPYTSPLAEIARRYKVPVVAPSAAEAFAFEHGERWT